MRQEIGYCKRMGRNENGDSTVRMSTTAVSRYESHPYLHEDMQVEVIRGPLQGVHGIFLCKQKHHRLVLGVRLIQQAAAVEINITDVVPI